LAFFVTGMAVWLEASRPPTRPAARVLPFLAAFGLMRGACEWVEMSHLISADPLTTLLGHLLLVAV
jgi:hypothetical protein